MKKPIKISALLLLPILLVSCGLFANFGKADVRIDIAPVASAGIGDTYARIYMNADGKLFPLDAENGYLAALVSEFEPTTIIIEGIPVGPSYQVLMSIGSQQDGWFDTWEWGESAEFTLEPGVNTPVSMSMQGSPFGNTFDLAGKSLVDVEVVGGTIYTAEAGTLWDSTSLFSTFNPTPIEPGYTANSLTEGIDFGTGSARLWINSNKGVLPFYVTVAPVFDTAFSVKLGAVPVLDSATRPSGSDHVVYFRRSGGLGGTFVFSDVPDSPELWEWVNLDSEEVYDLITLSSMDGSDGYFAAPGGSFRLPQPFLQDATPTIAEHKLPLKPPAKVLSWELMYDNYGDGDLLFLGTEDGAWQVSINGGFWEPASLQRIAGTEGEAILMTETFTSAGYQFAAFLSPTALYLYTSMGPSLTRYPLAAGLPGGVTGMDFTVEFGSSVYLMISSEEGLFYVYVTGLPV